MRALCVLACATIMCACANTNDPCVTAYENPESMGSDTEWPLCCGDEMHCREDSNTAIRCTCDCGYGVTRYHYLPVDKQDEFWLSLGKGYCGRIWSGFPSCCDAPAVVSKQGVATCECGYSYPN